MAAPAFHLLLPLPVLLLASLLLSTAAAASHNPHGAPATHAHLLHCQSLRVLNPFFTPAAAQAPSGEEVVAAMGAAATDAERGNGAD